MTSFWRSGKDYDIESESRQLSRFGEPFLMEFLNNENLNYKKPIAVDFGCWSGRHLQLLERVVDSSGSEYAKQRVIGIDEPFARERLEQARRAYRGFEIFDDGIADTGLPSSSIDLAISWRVLHNLTDTGEWTRVLGEISRVLKHGAPLVVSVRATQAWMQQNAPMPIKYRTFSYGVDRDDLYFSEAACYAMFRFYGFDIPFKVERFTEEEVIEGVRVKNEYWLVPLVCNKRPTPEAIYNELQSRQPTGPYDSVAPKRRLSRQYR